MRRLLNQPYPFDEPASRAWWRAVGIGLFVGLFLVVFQPFGADQWKAPHKVLKLLGFGVVSFAITAFNFLVWPRLFPRVFREQTWTVGKAILFITVNILLIALFNRLYLAWIINSAVGASDLTQMIGDTFLLGIFPTTGAVVASYVLWLRRYVRQAAELPVAQPSHSDARSGMATGGPSSMSTPTMSPLPTLTLVADNEKDVLTFPASDLLFIESADNYCTVHYVNNGQPVKPLLRSSLSRLAGQVNVPHIVRCHRSYVVNLDRVERVTGNAQGYKLHLLGGTYQIPVARQYNDTLVAELKGL